MPSADVVTTAVVFAPFTKFTVSYGFTKSRASPLFCKFQPAFNTSDTVAALLPAKLGLGFPSFVGFNKSAASVAVNGALLILFTSPAVPFSVPSGFVTFLSESFTAGILFFTLPKDAGRALPFSSLGPFTDVFTSPFGTTLSFSPFPSGVVWYVTLPLSSLIGYTVLPSLSV